MVVQDRQSVNTAQLPIGGYKDFLANGGRIRTMVPISRRAVLRIGGILGISGVAGCLGREGGEPAATPSGGISNLTQDTIQVKQRIGPDEEAADTYPTRDTNPSVEIAVGVPPTDGGNPHSVHFLNKSDQYRDMIRVTTEKGGEAGSEFVFRGVFNLAPRAYFSVVLWEPGRYVFTVEVKQLGVKQIIVSEAASQNGRSHHEVLLQDTSISGRLID